MMTRHAAAVMAAIVAACLISVASAQNATDLKALGKEIEALKAGQKAMQKDLQDIKTLLQANQAAPAPAPSATVTRTAPASPEVIDLTVGIAGAPVKGEANAKVTVVEFTDYQCPFCSRYFRQTWPQLDADYVKTGKAKFVLRDLPLESIHPQAFKAAEASHCAGEQGKFWEMHDRMFANQTAIGRPDLSGHAQALGLDVGAFDKCIDSGKEAARIRKDIADSEKAGARGTPIFFLGLTDPNSSELKAVRVIRGAHTYPTFKEAIDSLLATAK
jgi:protein-disulfide isomerase